MISVLALCPTDYDATSFYRGMGPLGRLKQATGQIELIMVSPVDWPVMSYVDVCFLQRPFTSGHETIAKLANRMQTPLWLDYDDDLFCITGDNPARHSYNDQATQARIKHMLEMASVITVSTEALKWKLDKMTMAPIHVIPNALDDRMLAGIVPPESQHPCVLWRGSESHQRDLMEFAEQIFVASETYTRNWMFLGYNPFFLTEQMKQDRVMSQQGVPPEDYFGLIHDTIKPSIVIVPLADTEFNRSKSNIAWIEGTLAGAACLVPDWEEWRRPGAITYKDAADFGVKLQAMLAGEIDLKAKAKESWAYIQSNLRLSEVNRARLEILVDLVGRR